MCLAQAGAQLAAVSCPPWLRGGAGDEKGGEGATRKQRDIIPLSKQARTHRRISFVKASQRTKKQKQNKRLTRCADGEGACQRSKYLMGGSAMNQKSDPGAVTQRAPAEAKIIPSGRV